MPDSTCPSLTPAGRYIVLAVAFLGWFCAGMDMAITQTMSRAAAVDLLGRTGALDTERHRALSEQARDDKDSLTAEEKQQLERWDEQVASWFAWYQCAFLFGAASGGLLFGWLGDRFGRARGMTISILTYSGMAGVAFFAQSPDQLCFLWYLACLGVGGMWPNGVALVSEAWAGLSRPMTAGLIGSSANIGIFALATAAAYVRVAPDQWRWLLLVGAAPIALGLFSLFAMPESPRWLAAQRAHAVDHGESGPAANSLVGVSVGEVFRQPWLAITFLGITLATVPMFGGWGSANWMIPWADTTGDPYLKAQVQQARSMTGIVGSLLGGWIAAVVGRRLAYFLVSLCALLIAQYTFWFLVPSDWSFLIWVSALGFFSGIYFGWMPLYLPELFPTRIRSTGAGVSFNFGRIVTAATIFATGLMMEIFKGDFARIGRVTSLVFVAGLIAIWFAPDTSRKQMND